MFEAGCSFIFNIYFILDCLRIEEENQVHIYISASVTHVDDILSTLKPLVEDKKFILPYLNGS
jgi:hypothetical protein